MASIAITLKLSPLVCLCLCGECHRLDKAAVGGGSFFFGLLGAAAGAVIVIAGEEPVKLLSPNETAAGGSAIAKPAAKGGRMESHPF